MGDPELNINENNHRPAPSMGQKLKHVLIAMILGALLVQMFLFYGAVKSGAFTPASILIYIDNIYFISYLALCGIIGWVGGQDFLDWLNVKMEFWKFW